MRKFARNPLRWLRTWASGHMRSRRVRVISSVVVAVLAVGGVGVAALLAMDTNSSAGAISNPTRSPAEGGADLFASPLPSETALPTPTFTLTSETPHPEQPPNQPPPKAPAPPAPGYQGAPATNPSEAVAHAVTVGKSRGERVAAAVLDRRTGTFYGAGDVDYGFASASVMKTFIAARLLVDGKANDPAIKDQMRRMIVASDDKAATALYPLVGREDVVPWVASRYHISGLAPANIPNYWGLTRITARAMVNFYAAVARDSVVGPWLMDAMAHAQANGSDGFAQLFGIPAAAKSWRVKQGWMCCLESVTRMHSTGFVDGDRYTVALLTEGGKSVYGSIGAQTLTLMAKALMPGGSIPWSGPQPPDEPLPTPTTPAPTSKPTPTPSPTPTTPPPSPSTTSPSTTPSAKETSGPPSIG
jgi:hypothetical protein